jgi:MFS family permease
MLPLFVMGHFGHHVMTTITVPLIPFIRGAFDLDYTQSGLVVSAFTLAYGFGQLPAGWLADRIDPRRLMTLGISGLAMAGILAGLSQTYWLLVLSLVLMGLLAGGYHPSAPPLISASVRPEHLGKAFGFHNIGGGASHLLTPLVAVAIASAWGWRQAYLLLGLPTIAFGLLFYALLGRMQARSRDMANLRQQEADRTSLLSCKAHLVFFLVLTTFTSAAINSIYAFVPLLMVDHFGVGEELAAASLSVISSAVFWAGPLGGYLSDRFGSVRVIIVVCFAAGPAILLTTLLPYGWPLGVLLLVLGMIIYTRMSASESFIVTQTPAGIRSTVLGIYYFTGMEGGGVLTPVVGWMIDRFGFTVAFAGVCLFLLTLTLLCSFWLRGRTRVS